MLPELLAFLARTVSLFAVSCGFCLFLIFVIAIGFLLFYITAYPGGVEKDSWSTLAQINNLEFRSSPFSNLDTGSKIIGHYRGHFLELKYEPGRYGDTTSLALHVDNREQVEFYEIELIDNQSISVQDIINVLVPDGLPSEFKGNIRTFRGGFEVNYQQSGRETDIEYLQTIFDLACDIAAGYPKILSLGGEAIPALRHLATRINPLRSVSMNLIRSIGWETQQRLRSQVSHMLCVHCFVYCAAHKVTFGLSRVTYFGCRNCGQSDQFLDFTGSIIAVLDSKIEAKQWEQGEQLWVNWSVHQKLFDFHEVQIIHATDEEAERFAMQVGNDTDIERRQRYQNMRCRLSLEAELSENTRRILRKTFGQVEEEAYLVT